MQNFNGQIIYYRVFDIAAEIDTNLARELLSKQSVAEHFKLRRSSREMVIEQAPVVMNLGTFDQTIRNREFPILGQAKLWSFGAVSISFRLELSQSISIQELKSLAASIEMEDSLHEHALEIVKKLIHQLGSCLTNQGVWDQYEDYLIYNMDPHQIDGDIKSILDQEEFYQLIFTEEVDQLSEGQKNLIRQSSIQYGKNDLIVIDWNSAFICSQGDSQDVADVIEFALCQLLELRYYDELLDHKLSNLYKSIQNKEPSLLSNQYNKFSHEAAVVYIEISDIVEKIQNSLKVIGDFYYARIFRLSVEKFRCSDWQKSVDSKLNNLAEVSRLFHSQVNERRNQLLEIIIIVLIAVELIPFIQSLFAKF